MLFANPSTFLVGALSCIALLPQQVSAAHIPYEHRHRHGHGSHRHDSSDGSCAAPAPAPPATTLTEGVDAGKVVVVVATTTTTVTAEYTPEPVLTSTLTFVPTFTAVAPVVSAEPVVEVSTVSAETSTTSIVAPVVYSTELATQPLTVSAQPEPPVVSTVAAAEPSTEPSTEPATEPATVSLEPSAVSAEPPVVSTVASIVSSTEPSAETTTEPTTVSAAEPSTVSTELAASTATTIASAVSTSTSTSGTFKARSIIPYYQYPDGGSWSDLEDLITTHSDVQFTIIINPSNGPGTTTTTDENFLAAVPKLASHSNALVIGYVSTEKGTRDIADVEKDIQAYAAWPSTTGSSAFAVHGIFLDEAPADYDADTVTYYKNLCSTIRSSDGLGPNNYVVTNPGAVPHEAYLSLPDSTVIFESPYSEFQTAYSANEFEKVKGLDLSRFASMVYEIPADADLSTLVSQLRSISGHTYMSNLDSYQVFDSLWSTVMSLLSA